MNHLMIDSPSREYRTIWLDPYTQTSPINTPITLLQKVRILLSKLFSKPDYSLRFLT